ncbi:unnamed protein product, partial [Symbiodinium necroappetens]
LFLYHSIESAQLCSHLCDSASCTCLQTWRQDFPMKRPAAAASRKHVRKGTLKKPVAAPVAYDVQIAALTHEGNVWTEEKFHSWIKETIRKKEPSFEVVLSFNNRVEALSTSSVQKEAEIWATLAKYHGNFDRLRAGVLQQAPKCENPAAASGSRAGISLGKMTEWNSADYDHFIETTPRFADNRATDSPHF